MIETMYLTRIYPSNKVRKKTPGTTQPGYAPDRHFMSSSGCLESSVCPIDAIPNGPRSPQEQEDFPCEERDLSIPYGPAGKVVLGFMLTTVFTQYAELYTRFSGFSPGLASSHLRNTPTGTSVKGLVASSHGFSLRYSSFVRLHCCRSVWHADRIRTTHLRLWHGQWIRQPHASF
jgi:hypothetical protein